MSRARRARRIAAAAAFGGGGLGALGMAGVGLLAAEARLARRWIGTPFGKRGPDAAGLYHPPGRGPDRLDGHAGLDGHDPTQNGTRPERGAGRVIEFAMLGDSSAMGLGVHEPSETPGAALASGLAAVTGRTVRLRVMAVVGAESRNLDDQVARWLADCPHPDIAVVMVGANDVTHRVRPDVAVRALESAVRRMRESGAEVVVATCPDLGSIEPIAQPLKYLARRWSRELAAAQTIAVVEAGGRTVSLGDLLGPEFASRPSEMFSADRFHPSAAGYRRAVTALLPSVCAVAGVPTGPQHPDLRSGEGMDDVAHAAARAAAAAGTEVSGGEIGGSTRGPRGRWAVLLRRGPALPAPVPGTDPDPAPGPEAGRETSALPGQASE